MQPTDTAQGLVLRHLRLPETVECKECTLVETV